jgi:hypothetical protein
MTRINVALRLGVKFSELALEKKEQQLRGGAVKGLD